jgi:hypothetical protein
VRFGGVTRLPAYYTWQEAVSKQKKKKTSPNNGPAKSQHR